jgi:hypothetical protein
MKKIFGIMPVLAMIAMLAVSCNNKATSSDPKVVLKEFFERMSKKDIDGASKLATKDSKSTMDMMKKGMTAAKSAGKDLNDDEMTNTFKQTEFGEAKIDGNNATVPVMNKEKGETIEFPLKKEDGGWKVDFSMATLMKMGQDRMGKGDAIDGMTDHDGDTSIRSEDLEKSMKAYDSIMKNMDPKKLEEMQKMVEKMQKGKDGGN